MRHQGFCYKPKLISATSQINIDYMSITHINRCVFNIWLTMVLPISAIYFGYFNLWKATVSYGGLKVVAFIYLVYLGPQQGGHWLRQVVFLYSFNKMEKIWIWQCNLIDRWPLCTGGLPSRVVCNCGFSFEKIYNRFGLGIRLSIGRQYF